MEIITANSLGDGRVVFQTSGGWSHDIARAEVLESKASVEVALARANYDAAENRVVEPYAVEVKREGSAIVAVRLRERIRADGPTTGNSKPKHAARGEAA